MAFPREKAIKTYKCNRLLAADGKKAKMIQVKTTEGPRPEWVIPPHTKASPDLVFVFVNLAPAPGAAPSFHIVPGALIEKTARKQYEDWKRKKTAARNAPPDPAKGVYHFIDEQGAYRDKWEHLGLSPAP